MLPVLNLPCHCSTHYTEDVLKEITVRFTTSKKNK